ncbi:MAG: nicotinate-nicotinamide nucleotide adenylyltransferase [Spirochaetales bacterium]|nr:nicotinate-nicotinamide nucleotide adenylyltransferase [Spirochaetales bacterium]
MTIVIFGGTFDPWTSAHQEITERLAKKYDKVFVIPTNVSYYRSNEKMYSFDERVELAGKELSNISNVEILTIERSVGSEWRYIDTLKEVIKIFGKENQYFTAIGSDSLQKFTTWTKYEEILNLSKLIVFNRPEYTTDFPDIEYEYLPMDNPISSTQLRNEKLRKN